MGRLDDFPQLQRISTGFHGVPTSVTLHFVQALFTEFRDKVSGHACPIYLHVVYFLVSALVGLPQTCFFDIMRIVSQIVSTRVHCWGGYNMFRLAQVLVLFHAGYRYFLLECVKVIVDTQP